MLDFVLKMLDFCIENVGFCRARKAGVDPGRVLTAVDEAVDPKETLMDLILDTMRSTIRLVITYGSPVHAMAVAERQIRTELDGLTVGELHICARKAGFSRATVEKTVDEAEGQPRQAVIERIVGARMTALHYHIEHTNEVAESEADATGAASQVCFRVLDLYQSRGMYISRGLVCCITQDPRLLQRAHSGTPSIDLAAVAHLKGQAAEAKQRVARCVSRCKFRLRWTHF